jgi:hypothetical protein
MGLIYGMRAPYLKKEFKPDSIRWEQTLRR